MDEIENVAETTENKTETTNTVEPDIVESSTQVFTPVIPTEPTNKYTQNRSYCKNWNPLHDIVLNHFLTGKDSPVIAKLVGRSGTWVRNVISDKIFTAKVQEVINKQRELVLEPWEEFKSKKGKMVKEAINLALFAEKEQTRADMTKWCLERFPEFAPKNIPQLRTDVIVRQLSQDDIKRVETAASKMDDVIKVLEKGNPNVIEQTVLPTLAEEDVARLEKTLGITEPEPFIQPDILENAGIKK